MQRFGNRDCNVRLGPLMSLPRCRLRVPVLCSYIITCGYSCVEQLISRDSDVRESVITTCTAGNSIYTLLHCLFRSTVHSTWGIPRG